MENIVKIKKGEKLLRIGEKPDFVVNIKSGTVKIYQDFQNREIYLANLGMLEELMIMLAINGAKSDFEVVATSTLELVKIPKDEFLAELKNNPKKNEELLQKLTKLFLEQIKLTTNIIGADATGKVASVILSMENSKIPLTHKLVANLTGLTRETVTLQMLKMEKMKLVDNANRKVKILDKKGLEKLIKG